MLLTGHDAAVLAVAFSADAKTLASAAADGKYEQLLTPVIKYKQSSAVQHEQSPIME